jgi:uncharacterized protein with HEPN domain
LSRDDFDVVVAHQESVAYNLMIVGEAASKLSEQTRAKFPTIPWNEIKGMRNQIVHGYAETERDTLWETVTSDLPLLIAALEARKTAVITPLPRSGIARSSRPA